MGFNCQKSQKLTAIIVLKKTASYLLLWLMRQGWGINRNYNAYVRA